MQSFLKNKLCKKANHVVMTQVVVELQVPLEECNLRLEETAHVLVAVDVNTKNAVGNFNELLNYQWI